VDDEAGERCPSMQRRERGAHHKRLYSFDPDGGGTGCRKDQLPSLPSALHGHAILRHPSGVVGV